MSTLVARLGRRVDGLPRPLTFLVSFALVIGVGVVDIVLAGDIVLSIFYAVPIAVATWSVGQRAGLSLAVLATALWTVGDASALGQGPGDAVLWWNAAVRLAFFAIVVVMLSALRRALREEQRLAREDPLTGVANLRDFSETACREIMRSQRTGEPLTIAVLDVDNLKEVNDRQGHAAGDSLLVAVAQAWRSALRRTDLVARIGGDEFAVLLPHTGAEAAGVAITTGRQAASAAILHTGWVASVSLGAVTYLGGPTDVDDLLREADALMYDVKAAGKGGVKRAVLAPPSAPAHSTIRP